jgi:hypothetical protein
MVKLYFFPSFFVELYRLLGIITKRLPPQRSKEACTIAVHAQQANTAAAAATTVAPAFRL